jgi:hypothetical protein
MEILKALLKFHSEWHVRHWRQINGIWTLLWEDIAIERNILHDTGEQALLSAFFATAMTNFGAPPANLYLGLDKRASLAEADTLATLDEIVKSGYERKAESSAGTGVSGQDFYINQPAAYYRAEAKTVTWTAGENWVDALKNIFLCTDITAAVDGDGDHLICSLALSANRTLLNGDKLEGSMYIGLSE